MDNYVHTNPLKLEHKQFGFNDFLNESPLGSKSNQQNSFLHVSKLICSSLDLHPVLSEIAMQLVKLLSATSSYIYSNNPLNDTSVVLAEYYDVEASDKEKRSTLGEIYKVHRNFVSDDFNPYKSAAIQYRIDDEDIDGIQIAKMMKYGAKTILTFPLQVKGKIIAYAEIWESRHIREFSHEECLLAEELAQYAAIAIENARINNEAQLEIEKRERIQKHIEYDTFHDHLTGLPNRSLIHDRISNAIGSANEKLNSNYAILLIGLDHFKTVNDSLGHQIGDKLLVEVADRLQLAIRSQDTLARVGGDEFAILVENIQNVGDAIAGAVDILTKLKTKFDIGPYEICISASIGIVMGGLLHDSPDQVLRDAEIALYRAKGDGRGGYIIFHPDMQSAAMGLYQTVGNLRNALEKDEFELYYQPIVSLASNHLMGFEALIRWNHPKIGVVPAIEFISIVEESGLIYPIGIWTLQKACEQMAKWQNQFRSNDKLTISINISAKQLQNNDLVDEIHAILSQTGISPDSLVLEITENSVIQNMALASQITRQLKQLGVQIHLDDFGVGYSSLNVLLNLPIDALKLDKSFISGIAKDPRSFDIVKSVLLLCRNLNIDVVAEGIETELELDVLKNMQCELGQGYYFSKPMEEENASSLILQHLEK